MEAKLHRRIQRYGWDLAVQDYGRYWVPVLRGCAERCVEMADIHPGDRVLDAATGTGVAAFAALEAAGPTGEVVATDISQKMVDAIRTEAEHRGIANIHFARMDCEELDLPDASFDAVVCSLGLMYPADPQRAIEEFHRVLRPGGRAAVCVWGRRDRCGWNAVFPIVDARVESDVCPLFFALGAQNALAYAFHLAGFEEMTEERVEKALEWPTGEAACTAIFAGGPVALAYSRFTPEVREAVHAEFLASIAAYRAVEGYRVPGEFVFLTARK